MCTALTLETQDHYFGRNLDLEYAYDETVTIVPRNFPLHFRKNATLHSHYAMIGMAYVQNNYPLFYDATNEKGLSMAGLNFPGNAEYAQEMPGRDNIAPFEFIPWILSQCADVDAAEKLLKNINLAGIHFRDDLPLTPLHWMIADRRRCIVAEPMRGGLRIHADPIGILTNNPPFEQQLFYLNNYMHVSARMPENRFSDEVNLQAYSRGMGGMGLPGDWSSSSRFARAAFVKLNSVCGCSEAESVSQFFHILDSVAHPRGAVDVGDGKYEITVYSSCCNTARGIYYYKTYENSRITAVDMHRENLDGDALLSYPLQKEAQILWQNG